MFCHGEIYNKFYTGYNNIEKYFKCIKFYVCLFSNLFLSKNL